MGILPRKHKLRRFFALGGPDKWMLLHATVWLALARLMLLFMPFRRMVAKLSNEGGLETDGPDPQLVERIGYAVRAAAANVPWRSDCFPQSIAARMLLKHHGYDSTIHIGVKKRGKANIAGHAWVTCGCTVVVGREEIAHYTEILSL